MQFHVKQTKYSILRDEPIMSLDKITESYLLFLYWKHYPILSNFNWIIKHF